MPVKGPNIGRALDALRHKVVNTTTKHPGVTAGLIGTGVAATQLENDAIDTEERIMQEQVGASGAKYAGVFKSPARDAYVQKVAAMDSVRHMPSLPAPLSEQFTGGLASGVGSAAAQEGAGALKALMRIALLATKDKAVQDARRRKIIEELIANDPIVSTFEREIPGGSHQAFQTMRRWAPELSTDPNVVRSYLRQAAQTGGTIDYPALKALTDAELSALKARHER